jgi:site-specific DNA-adenine methylase
LIYLGSKNRISKYIAPIIQSYIDDDCKGYLEPFVGGGNMIDKITCKNRIGSDIDKYVIAVLSGLQNGIEPPKEVSKDFYDYVKENRDSCSDFLVGYVGYEMSFGAKWFGGYVKRDDAKHRGDIYSYKSCMKQAPKLANIEFKCCSFDEYKDLEGYVIYCDPPYYGTTPYKQMDFPYRKFYDWCRKMSNKNTVLISEYYMPDDFVCIWEKDTIVSLDSNKKSYDENNIRTERLYIRTA